MDQEDWKEQCEKDLRRLSRFTVDHSICEGDLLFKDPEIKDLAPGGYKISIKCLGCGAICEGVMDPHGGMKRLADEIGASPEEIKRAATSDYEKKQFEERYKAALHAFFLKSAAEALDDLN